MPRRATNLPSHRSRGRVHATVRRAWPRAAHRSRVGRRRGARRRAAAADRPPRPRAPVVASPPPRTRF
eukprot:scaffold252125_cov36-Tisochrysis_lutea.AAC.1